MGAADQRVAHLNLRIGAANLVGLIPAHQGGADLPLRGGAAVRRGGPGPGGKAGAVGAEILGAARIADALGVQLAVGVADRVQEAVIGGIPGHIAHRLPVGQAAVGDAGLIEDLQIVAQIGIAPAAEANVSHRGPLDVQHLPGAADDIQRSFVRLHALLPVLGEQGNLAARRGLVLRDNAGNRAGDPVPGAGNVPFPGLLLAAFGLDVEGITGVLLDSAVAGKGLRQIHLIIVAVAGVDQKPVVQIEANAVILYVPGHKLSVGIERVVKEAARGVDQAAARGHKAPEPRRGKKLRAGPVRKGEAPDLVSGGEDQRLAVHQIELAHTAGEALQKHLLRLGRQIKGAQRKLLLPDARVIQQAVGVVQPGHRALHNDQIRAAQLVDGAIRVVYVVLQLSDQHLAAAAGEHIRRVGAEGADGRRQLKIGQNRPRRAAAQQNGQKNGGNSLVKCFHGNPR